MTARSGLVVVVVWGVCGGRDLGSIKDHVT